VLLDGPRRREAAHGSDDSAISALPLDGETRLPFQ
jgi:hypothetical protein